MTLISEREQDVAQAWGLQGRGGAYSPGCKACWDSSQPPLLPPCQRSEDVALQSPRLDTAVHRPARVVAVLGSAPTAAVHQPFHLRKNISSV